MLHALVRRGGSLVVAGSRATTAASPLQLSSVARRSLAAAAAAGDGEDKVVVVDDYKAFSDQLSAAQRVVAYFTASWCPPCRTISPVYSTLSKSSKHGDVTFLKIDVDANEEAASKSNIRTIPAFHFYKGGKLVGSFVGADSKKLTEAIEDLQARP